ncbi:hypothetical protein POSPLADRAFT_1179082 [Postia placenta MAD-698-R-SB12]|uniref:protein-tyrosine-phosphatase n=1 Tax=Postia placenta MAD-698-R-SB12 TaxID=670580 RepID=A0A1X6NA47_9APHY|nr:hypothetical protein POSPLADRAFT_1179082 [Postia placenta MAD-698-R-SB12]OSX65382.1 hypothetical protein POSPLADRAFT_1179082 [Postia placenta MAD-698-R-SB12]
MSLTMPSVSTLHFAPAPPPSPSPTSTVWYTPATGFPGSPAALQQLPPTEIVPRLFIADLAAAESAHTLLTLGITHVLSAMNGRVHLPPAIPLERLHLPLQDSPFAELAAHLPASTSFVADALRDPNARVLVHCAQGISRSSSIVCAYLIAKNGWSPDHALQFVKNKYSIAEPNPGFVMQLGEYARSLQKPA